MSDSDSSLPQSSRPKAPFNDTRTIDLRSHGELEFWLKVFDTGREELEAAIAQVGPYAKAVAIHLRNGQAEAGAPDGEPSPG